MEEKMIRLFKRTLMLFIAIFAGFMMLSLTQNIIQVSAATGEALLFDDYFETWNIGATGRPADEEGREYGRDEGALPAIPSPFPFNDKVKFVEQIEMRGGRVNPTDTTYFTRNRYMMQPLLAQGSSMTYEVEGAEDVSMMVSFQIFDPNPLDIAKSRVKLWGSVDGTDFTEIPLDARLIDIVGVNHWVEMTNRQDFDETYTQFKFTFHLLNNNVWEILVISTEFKAKSVAGEVALNDSFNGQWPIDEVGVNEDLTPNYSVGGRLPYIDPENTTLGRVPFADNFTPKSELLRYEGLTNGRVQPNPANFQYNDWVLILAARDASIVYEYDRTFQNFSLVIFRQIWENSLETNEAVTVSVSADDTTYTEIVFNEQTLQTDGTNYYIQLTNVAPLEAGIKYIKIELTHFNDNFWELGLSNVRLMTDRSFGLPKYQDTFYNQWPIDALGVNEDLTPNYGVGGRLPYIDPENTALGRVPFVDNFTSAPEMVSYSGLTNGRVQPNPASFVFNDWMLILSATTAEVVYEYEDGFLNFNLQIFRQVYTNSYPMEQAVVVSVSNDGTTWEEVTINYFVERQAGVDTMFSVFNKIQFESEYTYIKVEFAHHNNNFWELGISTLSLFDASPDAQGEVDREAPVLQVNWTLADELDQNTLVTLPVATATDNADDEPVVTVRVESPVGSNVTVTNNQFYLTASGDYTVIYRAEDASGNFSTEEFVITSVIPVEEPEDEGMSTGAIVAIVSGSVVALGGGAAFILIRRKRLL
jgi:hypothetical protein